MSTPAVDKLWVLIVVTPFSIDAFENRDHGRMLAHLHRISSAWPIASVHLCEKELTAYTEESSEWGHLPDIPDLWEPKKQPDADGLPRHPFTGYSVLLTHGTRPETNIAQGKNRTVSYKPESDYVSRPRRAGKTSEVDAAIKSAMEQLRDLEKGQL